MDYVKAFELNEMITEQRTMFGSQDERRKNKKKRQEKKVRERFFRKLNLLDELEEVGEE